MKVRKILVSQPKPATDKSPYYDIARAHGVEVVFRPFIKVEGLSAKEFRQSKINLADYTAVIFTARTAVDHYFRLCQETRFAVPDTMKYFCTTEQIALYLQKYTLYRKRKIFHGTAGKLAELLPFIQRHSKETFLYAVSDVNKSDAEVLDRAGITYTKAALYRTVSNDFAPGEAFDYDALLFFSPQGIQSLKKNFPDFEQGGIRVGCFGAATVAAAEAAGLRVDIQAPTPKLPSMTAALDDFLARDN